MIPGKTYDDLVAEYFDFSVIVMDIEGGELDFFRSFDLSDTEVRLIIWETHQFPDMLTKEELEECYTLLRNMGFKPADSSGNVEAWERVIS